MSTRFLVAVAILAAASCARDRDYLAERHTAELPLLARKVETTVDPVARGHALAALCLEFAVARPALEAEPLPEAIRDTVVDELTRGRSIDAIHRAEVAAAYRVGNFWFVLGLDVAATEILLREVTEAEAAQLTPGELIQHRGMRIQRNLVVHIGRTETRIVLEGLRREGVGETIPLRIPEIDEP